MIDLVHGEDAMCEIEEVVHIGQHINERGEGG